MSKEYGMMDSFDNIIAWVEKLDVSDVDYKERVLARMRYERDKAIPVKPRYVKGLYGKKYDTYYCGNCGHGISEIGDNYCRNCGTSIGWDSPRCLTK